MWTPRARRRSMTWLLVTLIILGVLGSLAFYRPFASQASSLPSDPTPGAGADAAEPPPPPLPGKRQTFLVLGVDKRPGDPGRSDTMVVLSYDPATQAIAMVSVARDTWAEIPGRGYDKVNHSYAYGGERLAKATIEKLLGVPIDHTITLSFQGFERIVDALGGVEIDAEKDMYYHDPFDLSMGPDGLLIDIKAGPQLMDGETALKYARFRMDEEGDLGRIRRQQQLARALIKAAAKPATIMRIPQLIPALASAIETDLTIAEMLKLATAGKDALSSPLEAGTFSGEDRAVAGIFYLIPDLVAQRTAAYKILVGTDPPADFIQRAEQDAAAYQQALHEALAAAAADPTDGADRADGEADPGDSDPGEPAEDGEEPDETPPTEPQPGENDGTTPPVPKPGQTQSVTVAVIDASGKGLAHEYAARLMAADFQVVRTQRSAKVVSRTVVIDHAGQPGTGEKVKAVLPQALVVSALDSRAPEALEIILGTDLGAAPKPKN